MNAAERYMTMALDEGSKCTPSDTSYCVGAVVVTCDGAVFTGRTHETGPENHAEEEAIRKAIDAGAVLAGATIYSSMEPCSRRTSKPVSCSELIIAHRFSRVVYALAEPDLFVRCEGDAMLRRAGVSVATMPQFAAKVREANRHLIDS